MEGSPALVLEFKGPRTRSSDVRGQDNIHVSAQEGEWAERGGENAPFLLLFAALGKSIKQKHFHVVYSQTLASSKPTQEQCPTCHLGIAEPEPTELTLTTTIPPVHTCHFTKTPYSMWPFPIILEMPEGINRRFKERKRIWTLGFEELQFATR